MCQKSKAPSERGINRRVAAVSERHVMFPAFEVFLIQSHVTRQVFLTRQANRPLSLSEPAIIELLTIGYPSAANMTFSELSLRRTLRSREPSCVLIRSLTWSVHPPGTRETRCALFLTGCHGNSYRNSRSSLAPLRCPLRA